MGTSTMTTPAIGTTTAGLVSRTALLQYPHRVLEISMNVDCISV